MGRPVGLGGGDRLPYVREGPGTHRASPIALVSWTEFGDPRRVRVNRRPNVKPVDWRISRRAASWGEIRRRGGVGHFSRWRRAQLLLGYLQATQSTQLCVAADA